LGGIYKNMNYTKPARGKESQRGFFSYIVEGVINSLHIEEEDTIYFDLVDCPGYGKGNMFDIAFINENKPGKNIEELGEGKINCYDFRNLNKENRIAIEKKISKHIIPNYRLTQSLSIDKYDIGIHRRSTDISMHHPIVPIQKYFDEIDLFPEDSTIFLMCDNKSDIQLFIEKYGDRVTTNETNSSNNNQPFFKNTHTQEEVEAHIIELCSNVYTLSECSFLICSKSNVSSFAIFKNSKLNYKVL